jgi:protein-S-isoprenylcysteine O-methyltransferase Ste14
MYFGFVAFLLGLSMLSGNLLAFLSPVFMFCVLNWMFIPYEEEKMENTFKREFLEYKQKVRRWL